MMPRRGLVQAVLVVAGTLSVVLPPVAAQEAKAGRKYALVVGVNRYDHEKLTELEYAVNDARKLGEVLTQQGFTVTVLSDETGKVDAQRQPTKRNIDRMLDEILMKKCQRDDLVLVALAGHGLQFEKQAPSDPDDSYFCPKDARPFRTQTSTLISLKKVYQLMEESYARTKVVLVDACRDDPDKDRGTRGVNAGSAARPPKGIAVLFSCRAGERAYENAKLKHGVFFYHIIRGLQGEAQNQKKVVTFTGLAAYVKQEVPDWIHANIKDARQSPNLVGDYSTEEVLARVQPGLARVEPSPVATPRPPVIPVEHPNRFRNSIEMELVLIPAGRFQMGSPITEADRAIDEGPQHEVTISKSFYLGRYTVTRGQFAAFVRTTAYQSQTEARGGAMGFTGVGDLPFAEKPRFSWRDPGFFQTDSHPVVNVTWNDAKAFCKWLSQKEQKTYRLPTEAEWEYACRAGTRTRFNRGDRVQSLAAVANVADRALKNQFARAEINDWNDGHAFTAPVGDFLRNEFGLFDMHGNVWQWCEDWYSAAYYGYSPKRDPQGAAKGKARVTRGGSFLTPGEGCRSACRHKLEPSETFPDYGFRVVCEPGHGPP